MNNETENIIKNCQTLFVLCKMKLISFRTKGREAVTIQVQSTLSSQLKKILAQRKTEETPVTPGIPSKFTPSHTAKKKNIDQQEKVLDSENRDILNNGIVKNTVTIKSSSRSTPRKTKKIKPKTVKSKEVLAYKEEPRTTKKPPNVPENQRDNVCKQESAIAQQSPSSLARTVGATGQGNARVGGGHIQGGSMTLENMRFGGRKLLDIVNEDSGQTLITKEARKLAKRALSVMAEIMNNPLARPTDRLNAAEAILEKAYGKTPAKGQGVQSEAPAVIVLPAFNLQVNVDGTGTRADQHEANGKGKEESMTIEVESNINDQRDDDDDITIN